RLIAWYAAMFIVSVAILLSVFYWITSRALDQQLTDSVERETSLMVEVNRRRGVEGNMRGIQVRTADLRSPRRYYLLVDSAGERIEGNLGNMPPFVGWKSIPIAPEEGAGAPRDQHTILALGTRLPSGHFLLVGENDFRTCKARESIVVAAGWSIAITGLLAICGGILLGRGFLRRIEDVNRTSRAIINGNLSDRVPTRGSGDEMDQLAINLNAMLDRIEILLDSLKRVSDDIAHDLRTPLSRLRRGLEAAREAARTQKDCGPALESGITEME